MLTRAAWRRGALLAVAIIAVLLVVQVVLSLGREGGDDRPALAVSGSEALVGVLAVLAGWCVLTVLIAVAVQVLSRPTRRDD